MPDSLRDRIAAVIYNELRAQADRDTAFPVMVAPAVGSPNFNGVALIDGEVDLDAAAAAVIEALGMQIGTSALFLVDGKKVIHRRYTTEWIADK